MPTQALRQILGTLAPNQRPAGLESLLGMLKLEDVARDLAAGAGLQLDAEGARLIQPGQTDPPGTRRTLRAQARRPASVRPWSRSPGPPGGARAGSQRASSRP